MVALKMELIEDLKGVLLRQGAALVGVGSLREIPREAREDLPRAISIGVVYERDIIRGIVTGPTAAYYEAYKNVNRKLDALSQAANDLLQARGYGSVRLISTDAGIDPGTLSTKLPHKTAATRAGLGWIGKCALLVTPQYGSALRLTTVLTDAPLPEGEPEDVSRCGDCTACVDACPGGAPSGAEWHAGMPRDSFFDAHLCRRTARATAKACAGIEDSVCGICIAACPYTRKYVGEMDRGPRPGG
jgi:epoxyqueuosine reductase